MTINDIDVTTVFTLLGAGLGSAKAFFKNKRSSSKPEQVINYMFSFGLAVALTDATINGHAVAMGAYFGVAAFWGLVIMDLVDALQNFAPTITSRFLKAKAKQILGIDLDDQDREEIRKQQLKGDENEL